jgi:hypothetical protein
MIEIYSEVSTVLYNKLVDKWKDDSKVKLYNNVAWDKVDKVKIDI